MEPAQAFPAGTTYDSAAGSVRIAEPGLFGINYGRGTPMGLLMGHVAYGLVVALVYGALT